MDPAVYEQERTQTGCDSDNAKARNRNGYGGEDEPEISGGELLGSAELTATGGSKVEFPSTRLLCISQHGDGVIDT
jgi:hypothetical protein